MLELIAFTAVFVICVCACIIVLHPKITMQPIVNLILLFLMMFGVALLVKGDFSPSQTGVLFLTCLALLTTYFTWGMFAPKFTAKFGAKND